MCVCVCVYVCVCVGVCLCSVCMYVDVSKVCVCEKLHFSEAAEWDVEEILVRIEFYI